MFTLLKIIHPPAADKLHYLCDQTMLSKWETLHGIELHESLSPLKKKLGDLRVGDSNILGNGNYVDVELDAVDNSTNPKKERPARQKLQNLPCSFAHRLMLKTMISPSHRPAIDVSEKRQNFS